MARYRIATKKTSSAAAGLIAQLRAGTTRDLRVYEVGIFAATAVAGEVALMRPTAVGSGFTSTNPGAAADPVSAAGLAVVDYAASTAPTVPSSPAGPTFAQVQLPATIGAGVILSFPEGIVVPLSGSLALWQLSTAAVTYTLHFAYDE